MHFSMVKDMLLAVLVHTLNFLIMKESLDSGRKILEVLIESPGAHTHPGPTSVNISKAYDE